MNKFSPGDLLKLKHEDTIVGTFQSNCDCNFPCGYIYVLNDGVLGLFGAEYVELAFKPTPGVNCAF